MRSLTLFFVVFVVLTPPPSEAGQQVDKVALLELLHRGDFEVLDARLTKFQEASEADDGQDEWVGVAFNTFASFDPTVQQRLDEWVDQMPGSYAALVARSFFYRLLGWHARGGAYASETSNEQFAGMRKHFSAARADLYAALRMNEKLSIAYSLLIDMASAEGKDEEEIWALTTGLKVATQSYHIRWMFLYSLQPKWGGSVDMIKAFVEAAVEPFPDDPSLRSLRGYLDWFKAEELVRKREYHDALRQYDRALEHGPHWSYLAGRAHALKRLERYDEALEFYNRAISLRPYRISVLASRGNLYFRMGRMHEALEDFNLAIALDSLHPGNLADRANVLRDLKRYDLALADLENALVYGSNNVNVRSARGNLLLFYMEDPAGALPDLERAVELAPTDANNWYNYGTALVYLHDCKAVNAFSEYQKLCLEKETCYEEGLKWSEQALQYLDHKRICPN